MENYVFGIDVGGTTVKCGLFTAEGTVLDKWEIRTNKENGGASILGDIADAINAKLKEKNIGDFLYIMKNITYMEYCSEYGVGEDETIWLLFPENLDTNYDKIVSRPACERSPID